MSRQALGNALAGVLFLIVAIVDFTRDSSGIGVVFVVFDVVYVNIIPLVAWVLSASIALLMRQKETATVATLVSRYDAASAPIAAHR
jgi:hypothetical protein